MKIVVVGGTGLIGSKVVAKLAAQGHEAVAASPNSGVNSVTGQGLAEVLRGASVIVDVSNSPSFDDAAVREFFSKSTTNLLREGVAAGVKHYVALSVVGTRRECNIGYFQGKAVQEELIEGGTIPYSIVHATQFFEFLKGIADSETKGNAVHLAPVLIQPLAAEDVARAVTEVTLGQPLNRTVEIAGPEIFRLDEFVRKGLTVRKDPREVITDPNGRYYGAELQERSLLPGQAAHLGAIRFDDWLRASASH